MRDTLEGSGGEWRRKNKELWDTLLIIRPILSRYASFAQVIDLTDSGLVADGLS